jgi:hypothetical protein
MGKPEWSSGDGALRVETLRVERKVLTLILNENPRGRFVRIVEDVNGRQDMVMVPAAGLRELRDALDRLIEADEATPRPPSVLPPV